MIQIRIEAIPILNKKELSLMEELIRILEILPRPDGLIAVHAQKWLDGNGDKGKLVSAIRQAEKECGNCGCELDPLYLKTLTLL